MDAVMIPMEKSKYSGRMVKRHVPYLVGRRLPHADAVLSMRISAEKRRAAEGRPRRDENEGHGRDAKWQEIIEYEAELNRLDQDEINALYASEQEKEEQERYFNQPDAVADYVHWSQCAHWTLDEAVALSLGREPRVVGINGVTAHAAAGSPFGREYLRRSDLVKRAREAGQLFEPTPPAHFLTWAKLRRLGYPKELEEALEARGHTFADMKKIADDLRAIIDQLMQQNAQLTQQNKRLLHERDAHLEQSINVDNHEKPLGSRERQSLEKIVYGMAAAKYGYEPNGLRSRAVPNICSDLEKQGVRVSDDKVREVLRAGAELRDRLDEPMASSPLPRGGGLNRSWVPSQSRTGTMPDLRRLLLCRRAVLT
jgi:hypothetical protein